MKSILIAVLACAPAWAQSVNIVFVGDSFTRGYVIGGGQSPNNYPTLTLPLLHPSQWDSVVHNLGNNSQFLGSIGTTCSVSYCMTHACSVASCPAFQANQAAVNSYIVAGKTNILVVEGGSADIVILNHDAATFHTDLLLLYSNAKSAGWDFVVATTTVSGLHTPQLLACQIAGIKEGAAYANGSATYITPTCTCPMVGGCDTEALGVNGRLRANKGAADVLIDIAAMAQFFSPYDATYRQADGHWTDPLNAVMAAQVAAAANSFFLRGAATGGLSRSAATVIK